MNIADIEKAIREQGFPEPTDRTANGFGWSATNNDTSVRHVLAVWWAPELRYENDSLTNQPRQVPTGREGAMVSGEGAVHVTVEEAVAAVRRALERQTEPALLSLFNLRRATEVYGHPLVAADYAFTHNDAGDVLRSSGVW